MTWFVILMIALVLLSALYIICSQKTAINNENVPDVFFQTVSSSISSNLERLKTGDLGWRRLGHGKSAMELKKTAPKKDDIIPVSMDAIKNKHPGLYQKIKAIDKDIARLQSSSNRLAKELEAPVREYFQNDRQRLLDGNNNSITYFRRWLIDHEDGWMEVLANLINDEETLKHKGDPAALYWGKKADAYKKIKKQHAGDEAAHLEELKKKVVSELKNLQMDIERLKESK